MAQTGFTPIITYHSTTGSAVPDAANLSPGEMALNIADMKLYAENSSGVVTLLASSSGASGDVVGPASATDNAVTRFDGTTGKLVQNSGVTIDDSNNVSGVAQLNATTADLTNIEVTNIKAKDGTAAGSIADSTGVVTLGSSVLTTTDINGGTIDNTAIGASSASTGAFTTLSATGNVTLGDASTDTVQVNGYMGVGGAANQVNALTVSGAVTAGTTQRGASFSQTLTTAATTNGTGIAVGPITFSNGSGITYAEYRGVDVVNPTKAGGSDTLTSQSGVYIRDLTTATNNYGITSLVSSGANKWNIYASGTAANYFAGNVQFAAGSAAAPALTRFGDDNTGIFFPAADTIAFAEGGVEAMRIDSSGNVGIGTSSPSGKLDVTGGGIYVSESTNTNSNIFFRENGVTKYIAGYVPSISAFRFSNGASDTLVINNSGNLGLGVTPSAWGSGSNGIEISGYNGQLVATTPYLTLGSNTYYNGSNYIYKTTNTAAYYQQNAGAHLWFTAPSGTAGNAITFTQAMTLDASGNLGVGTTSPASRLHVAGQIEVTTDTTTPTSGSAYFYKSNVGATVSGFNAVIETGSAGSRAERMRIDNSGNVGIGTSSPTFASGGGLNVANATFATMRARGGASTGTDFAQASDGKGYVYVRDNADLIIGTNNTERARITSGGNLLVGITTDQSSRIASDGGTGNAVWGRCSTAATAVNITWNSATSGDNLFESFFTDGGPSLRGSIDYNRAGGLVRYNTTSDYRAKDIIGPVQNTGATIDALKVYEGVMKSATQSRPMMIAHEAQAVVPFCVSGVKDETNEDGTPKYQQMDHASLVPLLIAEIQSLRQRVALLEGN